jgi:geranylgeranyl reductase family protein
MTEVLYDVAVVGAGPAGSTCAYYLARQGHTTLLLEKERFPRDKLCGDAVVSRAQEHMRTMGVLQEIVAENAGNWARVGGFIGPGGGRYITDSAATGTVAEPLVIAVKRIVLDEKLARAAARAGAVLHEDSRVTAAEYDEGSGRWTVHVDRQSRGERYQARALVIADGALTRLGRRLGLVKTPPDSVCSRAYVRAGTHRFDADGVVFYTARLLPGYAALFREANGELNYCCYIIPGGDCSVADLDAMHHALLSEHPYLREQLGPSAQIDKMRGAPLRLGGIAKSWARALLIVGDAAGHIDPLTGEGIQYAMDGGQLAADTLREAFAAGDLSERFLGRYHDRWMKAFGRDFYWSKKIVGFYAKRPLLIDGYVEAARRRGPEFFIDWAKIMTGAVPKTHFLKPRMAMPILLATTRLWWRRTIEGRALAETRA